MGMRCAAMRCDAMQWCPVVYLGEPIQLQFFRSPSRPPLLSQLQPVSGSDLQLERKVKEERREEGRTKGRRANEGKGNSAMRTNNPLNFLSIPPPPSLSLSISIFPSLFTCCHPCLITALPHPLLPQSRRLTSPHLTSPICRCRRRPSFRRRPRSVSPSAHLPAHRPFGII